MLGKALRLSTASVDVTEMPPVSPGIPSVAPRPLSGSHIPSSGAPGRTGELPAIPSHACAFR